MCFCQNLNTNSFGTKKRCEQCRDLEKKVEEFRYKPAERWKLPYDPKDLEKKVEAAYQLVRKRNCHR